eukprot:126297-Pelagomonas_calceolata.AAC.5
MSTLDVEVVEMDAGGRITCGYACAHIASIETSFSAMNLQKAKTRHAAMPACRYQQDVPYAYKLAEAKKSMSKQPAKSDGTD